MTKRFYIYDGRLFNYSGSLSRLQKYEIRVSMSGRMSVYSTAGKKPKFLGYISKMPSKLEQSSRRKVQKARSRENKKSKWRLKPDRMTREVVRSIGDALRDGNVFMDRENVKRPIPSRKLQSAINFDRILRMLVRDGVLTEEKIKATMDEDYEFTSISAYERDLFNAYQNADTDEERDDLWD